MGVECDFEVGRLDPLKCSVDHLFGVQGSGSGGWGTSVRAEVLGFMVGVGVQGCEQKCEGSW